MLDLFQTVDIVIDADTEVGDKFVEAKGLVGSRVVFYRTFA